MSLPELKWYGAYDKVPDGYTDAPLEGFSKYILFDESGSYSQTGKPYKIAYKTPAADYSGQGWHDGGARRTRRQRRGTRKGDKKRRGGH